MVAGKRTPDPIYQLCPLSETFYRRPTLAVASDLIGKVLLRRTRTGVVGGMIVEVEAYIGEEDPACHAASGPTPRNAPLYGAPGRAYVYLNYGIHNLMNAVTEDEGSPAAVLIRALAPIDGVAFMHRRHRSSPKSDVDLCRGPGNLTQSLGITLQDNGCDLSRGPVLIEDRGFNTGPIAWGPRVGIRRGQDRPWRCFVAGHPSVSRPRGAEERTGAARPRIAAGRRMLA